MRLQKVIINNFRSIKDASIEFSSVGGSYSSILFGKNETGKSNILKAIELRSHKENSYSKDCYKPAKKTNQSIVITSIYSDCDELRKLLNKLKMPAVLKLIYISKLTHKLEIDHTNKRTEEIYFEMPKFDFGKFVLSTNRAEIVESAIITPSEEILDLAKLNEFVSFHLKKEILDELPKIIVWKHAEKYLITKPIELTVFKANPENQSIPLRNIFALANYDGQTLKDNIDRALSSPEDKDELMQELSDAVTKHINDIWPEHKIKLKIGIDGSQCSVFVIDEDMAKLSFNMDERSDGFKQFVSLLLTLSADNKCKKIQDMIILLDEPEQSLHPSGIRYLRDEIIKLGKNNIVLASSHSPYLVDKTHLNRHYIVTKKEGLTELKKVDANNPFEEEVIYEALGTSLFELIQPNIVLFEGRIDKDIFVAFTKRYTKEIQPALFQCIFTTGANEMPKYAKFFNQRIVRGIFLLDSDAEGRKAKTTIIASNSELMNSVYELQDIVGAEKNSFTLEDLLPQELILTEASKQCNISFNVDSNKPILDEVKRIKRINGVNIDDSMEILKTEICHKVIAEVTSLEIKQLGTKYSKIINLVKGLHLKISPAQTKQKDMETTKITIIKQ